MKPVDQVSEQVALRPFRRQCAPGGLATRLRPHLPGPLILEGAQAGPHLVQAGTGVSQPDGNIRLLEHGWHVRVRIPRDEFGNSLIGHRGAHDEFRRPLFGRLVV